MSDEKKARSVEEITKEYGQLAVKAGHLYYQIEVLKDDLAVIKNAMKDLNFEAAKAANEEAKAKEALGKEEG